MNSIDSQDDDEVEIPRIHPVVNKESVRRNLSHTQILKLLEEENPSEWEPWQNFPLHCNTLR